MITWEFTDKCGNTITHIQTITINPAPPAAFINPPGDTTLSCGEATTFSFGDLSYTNNETGTCEISGSVPGTPSGSFDECGGSQMISWEFTDNCGNTITHVQTITIDPAPPAAFINPPGDTMLNCATAQGYVIQDLSYTNGATGTCMISGTVPGVLTGSVDGCDGVQTVTWTFTDNCGNTITHVQNLTIDPTPEAAFINPPADTTLSCAATTNFSIPDLNYSNNESDSCAIEGSVPGVLSGSFDECGGAQMITWEFTDLCGRTITYIQNITVDPAPPAAFINPPADTTISCGDSLTLSIPDLFYSNNETGACEISGSVPGTPSGTFDE
jgi:hypothetical protein